MKEVYKTVELLGWYSTNPDMKPTASDIKIHKVIQKLSET